MAGFALSRNPGQVFTERGVLTGRRYCSQHVIHFGQRLTQIFPVYGPPCATTLSTAAQLSSACVTWLEPHAQGDLENGK